MLKTTQDIIQEPQHTQVVIQVLKTMQAHTQEPQHTQVHIQVHTQVIILVHTQATQLNLQAQQSVR